VRERFRDVEHLIRMALLFVAGTLLFLGARAALLPERFGELGHFRPGAMDDNAARPLVYAGRAACAECHGEVADALAAERHAAIGCESCHGPLGAHAADPEAAPPPELDVVALCSRCHAANLARPPGQPQVEPVAHAEGNACTECHTPHAPAP
jgi:hypothetical protein